MCVTLSSQPCNSSPTVPGGTLSPYIGVSFLGIFVITPHVSVIPYPVDTIIHLLECGGDTDDADTGQTNEM